MIKHRLSILRICLLVAMLLAAVASPRAQVNTDQVLRIGQNALFFEDYMLSIQYFNQAIQAKPYLAKPYFLRAIAKLNLEDYRGAEADASTALEMNPFLSDAWEVRGVARQNLGKNRMAVDDYDEALKLLPHNRSLMFNKALALTDLKDYTAAAEVFDDLIKHYPSFENALLGRARIKLIDKDTVAAIADIDKALGINSNAVNAYIMRADISINSSRDLARALEDIDHAIRLQPRAAGLYINRAFLRYKLDNYTGAMADYDYALTLEPYNMAALFNRGLLLLEVNANDLALDDFNRVLELEPDDVRALYNRAIIHTNKGNLRQAVDDISRVAEAYPQLPDAFLMRAALYRDLGRNDKAEADFKHGRQLQKQLKPDDSTSPGGEIAAVPAEGNEVSDDDDNTPSAEQTRRRFASLITVDDNADFREEYNNSAIRGRIQDRNLNIDIEPPMLLSFYTSPDELGPNTCYMREVDDLNATRSLRFVLAVTGRVPVIDENTAARHFQSIDYYNSYLATHTPRPVDFIGRALDFITVRDYQNALRDAQRAIDIAPDLPLAYMIRAQARLGLYHLGKESDEGAAARAAIARKNLDEIADDYRKFISLSPLSPVAWYNLANVLFEQEDYDGAIEAYNKAVELKPDFGQAYYNRGYIMLRNGRRNEGLADLSRAGELGIIPAYNLLKRISR